MKTVLLIALLALSLPAAAYDDSYNDGYYGYKESSSSSYKPYQRNDRPSQAEIRRDRERVRQAKELRDDIDDIWFDLKFKQH